MVTYRNCIDCGYCKHNRKHDYYWCVQFTTREDHWDVSPTEDGCTFGKDIEPEYEDEDKAYERYKENRHG